MFTSWHHLHAPGSKSPLSPRTIKQRLLGMLHFKILAWNPMKEMYNQCVTCGSGGQCACAWLLIVHGSEYICMRIWQALLPFPWRQEGSPWAGLYLQLSLLPSSSAPLYQDCGEPQRELFSCAGSVCIALAGCIQQKGQGATLASN